MKAPIEKRIDAILPNKRSRFVLEILSSLNPTTKSGGTTSAIRTVVTKKIAYGDFILIFPWSGEYVKQSASEAKITAIAVATNIAGINSLNNSLVFFILIPFRVNPSAKE